jgi:hypothetical protein
VLIRPAAAALWIGIVSAVTSTAHVQQVEYRDPQSRFTFDYPQAFGEPSPGTDNGFGDRVAVIRFSVFSRQGIGGEVLLRRGRPSLDLQAAGGLYDDIVTGALPPATLKAVIAAIPRLSVANVCAQIGRQSHIDLSHAAIATLPENQQRGIGMADVLSNHDPQVLRCDVIGDVVTFDKEAAMMAGGIRRRVYGAVRFLAGRYAMVEIVRAGGTPSNEVLDQMRQIVESFRELP